MAMRDGREMTGSESVVTEDRVIKGQEKRKVRWESAKWTGKRQERRDGRMGKERVRDNGGCWTEREREWRLLAERSDRKERSECGW